MIYRTETTPKGARHLEISIDDRAERVYFDVILAIYGTYEKSGIYKKWSYATLKTANKKFNSLEDLVK